MRVNVRNRALNLHQGRTHVPQEVTDITLWAGTHNIGRLVILSDDGYITFDAIDWCRKQNITIIMLDLDGNVTLTSGEISNDVGLRRLQYQADDTGITGYIARQVVRRKTLAQIEVLKVIEEEYKYKRTFKEYRVRLRWMKSMWDKRAWEYLEDGLSELYQAMDISTIFMLEARFAAVYWDTFVGIPIKWKPRDEKIVPPHWKSIGERISS